MTEIDKADKPQYRVPSMQEIEAIPWNGLKVASTFSGCGGSCLGYRMAGCKVVWANEFVPIAQESYCANKAEDCFLDLRDIRQVEADDILNVTQLKRGELDIFDGSPPCQAFSTAGKRHHGWGEEKKYQGGASQRNELLFWEYIRLLKDLQPRSFIAENVAGLVKGTAKGMFLEILKELKSAGYNVKCKVLDAKWLGVPQTRRRAIFIGIRTDLNIEPKHPKPLPYWYTVRDALPWIDVLGVRQFNGSTKNFANIPMSTITCSAAGTGLNRREAIVRRCADTSASLELSKTQGEIADGISSWGSAAAANVNMPSPTVQTVPHDTVLPLPERRKFAITEAKRLCGFPDDFKLCGSYAQQWERLGNSVPPVMMYHIATALAEQLKSKQ